jgi:CII-binding regulator of phage lambda lysogenization HflD|tara:strand:- start:130 stop:516 length:387 start_codon:yes stop_codon:yes gene_type:complete
MAWSGRSKIEVVNQKVEDLKPLIHKMESAIEKLSELNTSVSRMLAVHEERLTKQEEIDNVLFTKIDQLRDKMDLDHNSVLSRIRTIERKMWSIAGALAVISVLVSPVGSRIITSTLTAPNQSVILDRQ